MQRLNIAVCIMVLMTACSGKGMDGIPPPPEELSYLSFKGRVTHNGMGVANVEVRLTSTVRVCDGSGSLGLEMTTDQTGRYERVLPIPDTLTRCFRFEFLPPTNSGLMGKIVPDIVVVPQIGDTAFVAVDAALGP